MGTLTKFLTYICHDMKWSPPSSMLRTQSILDADTAMTITVNKLTDVAGMTLHLISQRRFISANSIHVLSRVIE